MFQEGIYPTRAHTEASLQTQGWYVYTSENQVLASLIMHTTQPVEYQHLDWPSAAPPGQTWVLHMLMVHPSLARLGIDARLVRYGLDLAAAQACTAVRLDTGEQNLPAVT